MKRKVIQIAGSTQLVSLPRKWAKAHNIQRGQEIEVQEDGNRVVISATSASQVEKAEVDISDLGNMTHRVLGSYYRAGVDELKVNYRDPGMIESVYDSLNRETMVGFEVLEQGTNFCVLKSVVGGTEEFDNVLRRVFLLLVNMSAECIRLLKERQFDIINSLSFMEKSNNRFTTICRRVLNKGGVSNQPAIGPLYFTVESLENLADQYKYIAQHYSKLGAKKPSFDADALATFEKANSMVRIFYELYYTFDQKKMIQLKKIRDEVTEEVHKIFERKVDHIDLWLASHSMTLALLVFNMVGPFIVGTVKGKKF